MNHIIVVNKEGRNIKMFPENVKGLNKVDFKKKFKKHLAFVDKAYEQVQTYLKPAPEAETKEA